MLSLRMTLFLVLVLACMTSAQENDDGIDKDCFDHLAHLADIFTQEHLEAICSKRASWLESAAQGEAQNFKLSEFKISKAEEDFMDDLSLKSVRLSRTLPIRPPNARPRKEYRMLSDDERRRLHDAMLVLKSLKVDANHNQYDVFVDYHRGHISPGAHWGPNFIGWHREYLLRLERALQLVDQNIMLPYWDSSMDAMLGEHGGESMMWTEDFMGNKDGYVTTGPFRNWPLAEPTGNRYNLWRGDGVGHSLFDDGDFNYVVNLNDFRSMTWHVDPYFETAHGQNHFWVGGVMGDVSNSPADPVFFLHHAFMDLVWEHQQQRAFTESGRDNYVYPAPDDEEAYGVGELQNPYDENSTIYDARDSYHFYDRQMHPFDEYSNYHGLRDTYRLYYYYDDRPSCNQSQPTCGSPYLFCMTDVYKCAPKLKLGGNCTLFDEFDSCHNGRCESGVCVFEPTTTLMTTTTRSPTAEGNENSATSLSVSITLIFITFCSSFKSLSI